MSVVRIVAIVLAGYLLMLVVVEVIGRAAGLPRLLSLGHLLSTPLARQLVGGVAGLGLAFSVTAVTVGPTGAASADTISMQPAPRPRPRTPRDADHWRAVGQPGHARTRTGRRSAPSRPTTEPPP